MDGEATVRVIGAGWGRTGTSSLKLALERLGFGPCHHMDEVFRHRYQAPTWEAAGRGETVDWPVFLRGWGAAVDFPAAFYYRELMGAFPEAKVILTVRDPEAWFDSFSATIRAINGGFPNRLVGPWLPLVNVPFRVSRHPLMKVIVQGDRASTIRAFVDHTAEVERVVPSERLLVFDVKQGWEPLCRFLGVPVPDGPFPRANDTKEFKRRVVVVNAICWVVLLAPVVVLAGIVLALG